MYMNAKAGQACLFELADVLEAMGIPYFLMQGTALGAYRDKGFVPTEKDIDLGILQEHLQPAATELLSRLMRLSFDVECFITPFTRPRLVVAFKPYDGHVAKADLVGLVRYKDKRFVATPQRSHIPQPYAIVHPADRLEHYRPISLFGREFLIPQDIEGYLLAEYGPGWTTPSEDHVSRTRVYNFVQDEGIPTTYLE